MSKSSSKKQKIKIFCSYAHKDEELREELAVHLKPLENEGIVTVWSDRKIISGSMWEDNINTQLNSAQIILLLISPDFLASDYCNIEAKKAIERKNKGECRIIPIILRPSRWEKTFLTNLKVLPKDGKPVTKWDSEDDAFLDISEGINEVIDEAIEEQNKMWISNKNSKIIVIEDDQQWRDRLIVLLENANYKVEAYNGYSDEVLLRLTDIDYELVIIDLNLDKAKSINEGKKIVEYVRKHESETPIIMISGVAELSDVRDAFVEFKISDFIEKGLKWDTAHFLSGVKDDIK